MHSYSNVYPNESAEKLSNRFGCTGFRKENFSAVSIGKTLETNARTP
jgi:hypothetical protein